MIVSIRNAIFIQFIEKKTELFHLKICKSILSYKQIIQKFEIAENFWKQQSETSK